jgi:hypothetical protein
MIPMRMSFRFSTVHDNILAVVEINSSGPFNFFLAIRLLLATVHPSNDHFDFLSYIKITYFVNNFLDPFGSETDLALITMYGETSGTNPSGRSTFSRRARTILERALLNCP